MSLEDKSVLFIHGSGQRSYHSLVEPLISNGTFPFQVRNITTPFNHEKYALIATEISNILPDIVIVDRNLGALHAVRNATPGKTGNLFFASTRKEIPIISYDSLNRAFFLPYRDHFNIKNVLKAANPQDALTQIILRYLH